MSRRLLILLLACSAALVAAVPAAAAGVNFKTPSGNIQCGGYPAGGGSPLSIDCYVAHADWATAPRPASCDLEWVPNEIWLQGKKPGTGTCRGDVGPMCRFATPRCRVLAYGTSVRIGSATCTSRQSGLTCRRRTGHKEGFRVSRQSFRLYR